MVVDLMPRFTFDVAELAPPALDLRVLEPRLVLAPVEFKLLQPLPRPWWLRPLRAVFRHDDPFRLDLASAPAPALSARLEWFLGAAWAAAGAQQGLEVGTWNGGLAVGGHGLNRVPAAPHVRVAAAELWPDSVQEAMTALRAPGDVGLRWLVLNGSVPRLDARLGIPEPGGDCLVARLPRLRPDQMLDAPSRLRLRVWEWAASQLAYRLVISYRELER